MSNHSIRSIQCVACASPLTLQGGNKVRSLTCQYCGSIMDVRANYKLLGRVNPEEAPYSQLGLGMVGVFNNVKFTIIGMIAWQSDSDLWIEYQLFSATHGYAFLTVEKGHYLWGRIIKRLPQHKSANLWELSPKDKFIVDGKVFQFYDYYQASIYYVMGELTWIAKVGDVASYAEGIAPPKLFSVEYTENELQCTMEEYYSPEAIKKCFSLEGKAEKTIGVHSAQPYKKGFIDYASKVALPFSIIVLILIIIMSLFFSGNGIYHKIISAESFIKGHTSTFEVTNAKRLLKLTINSKFSNAWVWLNISIRQHSKEGASGKIINRFGKQMAFYEGYDDEGRWSEGSRQASIQFLVPEIGFYDLIINTPEASFKRQGSSRISPNIAKKIGSLELTVKQGVVDSKYFKWLLIFFTLMVVIALFKQWHFESKRWSKVTERDED